MRYIFLFCLFATIGFACEKQEIKTRFVGGRVVVVRKGYINIGGDWFKDFSQEDEDIKKIVNSCNQQTKVRPYKTSSSIPTPKRQASKNQKRKKIYLESDKS